MEEKKKGVSRRTAKIFLFSLVGFFVLIIIVAIEVPKKVELNYPRYRDYPGIAPRQIASDLLEVGDNATQISIRNDSVMDIHNRANGHEYDAVVELVIVNGGTRATISTSLDDSLQPTKLLDAISARLRAQ